MILCVSSSLVLGVPLSPVALVVPGVLVVLVILWFPWFS